MWVFFSSVLKTEFKIKQEQKAIVFRNAMGDNEINSLGGKKNRNPAWKRKLCPLRWELHLYS